MISRFYQPSAGQIFFEDIEITHEPPHRIAQLGIARTFQNIELFDNATVLANLLVGRHRHRTTNVVQDMLFLPKVRKSEYIDRRRVEEVIDFLDLQRYRDQLIAQPSLRRAQGVRAGARAVHRAEASSARRAVVRTKRRGDRRHGLLDQ